MTFVVESLLPIIVSAVIVPLLGLLGARLSAWIGAKVKNETVRGLLERLDDAAFAAVNETLQASVDAAKAASQSGKLSPEVAKAAKDAALATLKAHVSLAEVARVFGCSQAEAERLAAVRIEAAVANVKRYHSPRISQTTAVP